MPDSVSKRCDHCQHWDTRYGGGPAPANHTDGHCTAIKPLGALYDGQAMIFGGSGFLVTSASFSCSLFSEGEPMRYPNGR